MKAIILLLLMPLSFHSFAQSDEEKPAEKGGFKKEKLLLVEALPLDFQVTPRFWEFRPR